MTVASIELSDPPARQLGQRVGMLAIGGIFFLSGFAAIIYQITWQRALFTIFGINVEATTVVVSGFLLGLGFGSLLGGRLSRTRALHLLVLFALIELGIGTFGLVSLPLFRWVGAQTLGLPTLASIGASIAVLIAPTLLMGATLPVLGHYLVQRSRNVGRSIGLLYAVNTLGSAAGCFASAIWLMHAMGMQGAVNVAAAINFTVGLCAVHQAYLRRGTDRLAADLPSEPAARPLSQNRTAFRWLLALAALTGYVSLSYEILWFRAFMIISNVAPGFAIVLGAYLLGLAWGSRNARRYCEGAAAPGRLLSILSLTILASSLLGVCVLPLAAQAAIWQDAVAVPIALVVLILLQTAVAGAIFPIVCHLGIAPDAWAGVKVSQVYIANILGSVAGTLITGFVLMDFLSTPQISAFLGALGAACALLVARVAPMSRARQLSFVACAGAILLVVPFATGVLFDRYYERITYRESFAVKPPFTEVVENKSGVITINANKYVYGGGMYDGVVSVDLIADPNMLIRPASLSLFHPRPREVLMIGLATGGWAQLVANHPQVERLTVVEINPGYLSLIRNHPEVESLLRNPKVEIVIDDGRRWIAHHPERTFDAIIQNTTFHFRPNTTNLLSAEYLELLKPLLRDDGILIYNTTSSLRVQRTGCVAFGHGMRVRNALAVSKHPLRLDHARLRAALAEHQIDGRRLFDLSQPDQSARLDAIVDELTPGSSARWDGQPTSETCEAIVARTAALRTVTDDNMGDEW
jgi:predicted membrane-bound spermidine synthase